MRGKMVMAYYYLLFPDLSLLSLSTNPSKFKHVVGGGGGRQGELRRHAGTHKKINKILPNIIRV